MSTKRITIGMAAIAIASLLWSPQIFAQRGPDGRGAGGWGMRGEYSRMYDSKTVETVSGEVVSVDRFTPRRGMGSGVHLTLKNGNEEIAVHLGPAWFIENQDAKISAGDKLEVKGSRITFDGKPALIAAEVKKGDAVLKLRDNAGVPVWSGWRRR